MIFFIKQWGSIKGLSLTNKSKTFAIKTLIHFCAFIPLIYTYYLAFSDALGADPVEAIIHFTGIGAFNLLLITLLVSPVAKACKLGFLIQIRRLLGLYAFSYALLHLVNFLAFEVQFDFSLFFAEIIKRPYITLGMIAFLIISTLALTSITFLKRKMGKKWQTLHNFNYLLVVVVAIHFYWSVKSDVIEPIIYFLLTIILISLRKKKIQRWFTS